MMGQAWFEMAEIRCRKFGSSVWIPLRAVQPICDEGKRGHFGFKEEFFGAGSLAIPIELKGKANKLGCAIAALAIATLLGLLAKSEHDKGEKHG